MMVTRRIISNKTAMTRIKIRRRTTRITHMVRILISLHRNSNTKNKSNTRNNNTENTNNKNKKNKNNEKNATKHSKI